MFNGDMRGVRAHRDRGLKKVFLKVPTTLLGALPSLASVERRALRWTEGSGLHYDASCTGD